MKTKGKRNTELLKSWKKGKDLMFPLKEETELWACWPLSTNHMGPRKFLSRAKTSPRVCCTACAELQVFSAGRQASMLELFCEIFPVQNSILAWVCMVVSYVNAHIITPYITECAVFKQQNSMISMAMARNWQGCLIDLVWWEYFWEK